MIKFDSYNNTTSFTLYIDTIRKFLLNFLAIKLNYKPYITETINLNNQQCILWPLFFKGVTRLAVRVA